MMPPEQREVQLELDGSCTRDALWGLRFDRNLRVLAGPVFPDEIGWQIVHVNRIRVDGYEDCAAMLREPWDRVVVGITSPHSQGQPLQRAGAPRGQSPPPSPAHAPLLSHPRKGRLHRDRRGLRHRSGHEHGAQGEAGSSDVSPEGGALSPPATPGGGPLRRELRRRCGGPGDAYGSGARGEGGDDGTWGTRHTQPHVEGAWGHRGSGSGPREDDAAAAHEEGRREPQRVRRSPTHARGQSVSFDMPPSRRGGDESIGRELLPSMEQPPRSRAGGGGAAKSSVRRGGGGGSSAATAPAAVGVGPYSERTAPDTSPPRIREVHDLSDIYTRREGGGAAGILPERARDDSPLPDRSRAATSAWNGTTPAPRVRVATTPALPVDVRNGEGRGDGDRHSMLGPRTPAARVEETGGDPTAADCRGGKVDVKTANSSDKRDCDRAARKKEKLGNEIARLAALEREIDEEMGALDDVDVGGGGAALSVPTRAAAAAAAAAAADDSPSSKGIIGVHASPQRARESSIDRGFAISVARVPLDALAPHSATCPHDGATLQPSLLDFCSTCRVQSDGVGCDVCGYNLCWKCTYITPP